MKNKLSIAVKTISILFVFALGVVSIIGSGGGGSGHGTTTTTTTTLPGGTSAINQNNIVDIIHGINPYASLGDGSGYLADLQTTDHACEVGDVITTGSISDPPAVNDTLTVTYNSCQELGFITDGTMTMTITEVSGNIDVGPPYSVTIHLKYNDLSSEDVFSGLVSTSSADMSISISEDAGNFSIKIQGDSLTQESEGEVETLSNFQIESTYDQNTSVFTQVLNGDLESTMIGFPITFNTTATFTGKDDLNSTGNPTAGVLQITTSVDNSQARLTAQADGVSLGIEVDADGDGDYEYGDSIPWADLENL